MQLIITTEIVKHLKCTMAGFKNMSKKKKKDMALIAKIVQEIRG